MPIPPFGGAPSPWKLGSANTVALLKNPNVTTWQGNASGLTIIGGTGSAANFKAQSTSHATRGFFQSADRFQVLTDGATYTGAAGYVVMGGIGALTISGSANVLRGFQFNPAISWQSTPASAFMTLFQFASTISLPGSLTMSEGRILTTTPTFTPATGTTTSGLGIVPNYVGPTFTAIAGGGTGDGYVIGTRMAGGAIGTGWRLGFVTGLYADNPGAGSGAINLLAAVYNPNLLTRGDKNYLIFSPNATASIHGGSMSIGYAGNVPPAYPLDVSGQGKVSGAFSSGVVSLTDGATINTDASLGNEFTVTLGGNRTLANPTNPTDGQKVVWRIKQDGTGSRTLALGSAFRFGTDITALNLTTTASKTDYIGAIYNSTDTKWDILAVQHGF